jgi:ABC-type uncharacterized transport system permease subunit
MMSVLQNAFANTSSSLVQSKITGNLVFLLLTPLSHWAWFVAYVGSSVVRGLVVGLGVLLAAAINRLAAQSFDQVPALGALLGAALLLLGHSLNIVLGVAGGFVHGLRLNFIEFLNWGGVSEGRPFVAFQLKDRSPWTDPR